MSEIASSHEDEEGEIGVEYEEGHNEDSLSGSEEEDAAEEAYQRFESARSDGTLPLLSPFKPLGFGFTVHCGLVTLLRLGAVLFNAVQGRSTATELEPEELKEVKERNTSLQRELVQLNKQYLEVQRRVQQQGVDQEDAMGELVTSMLEADTNAFRVANSLKGFFTEKANRLDEIPVPRKLSDEVRKELQEVKDNLRYAAQECSEEAEAPPGKEREGEEDDAEEEDKDHDEDPGTSWRSHRDRSEGSEQASWEDEQGKSASSE